MAKTNPDTGLTDTIYTQTPDGLLGHFWVQPNVESAMDPYTVPTGLKLARELRLIIQNAATLSMANAPEA